MGVLCVPRVLRVVMNFPSAHAIPDYRIEVSHETEAMIFPTPLTVTLVNTLCVLHVALKRLSKVRLHTTLCFCINFHRKK